jgi:signal transduction histidine kinase
MAVAHVAEDNCPVRTEQWRSIAAVGTWVVAGLPEIAGILTGRFVGPPSLAWGTAFLVFGIAMAPFMGSSRMHRRGLLVALLVTQSIAGLAMLGISGDGTSSATLVIVAAEVAATLSIPVAALWIVAHTMALIAIGAHFSRLVVAIAVGGAFAGFQAFAVTMVALAVSERVAREGMARANAELHATRALLAENSRADERLRIARDLHDTLGHHLTALSLQLDVASRLADGTSAEHVRQAHAITRLLLADVRDVVSQMRDSRIDLTAAIRTLAAPPPGDLQIHLDVPESFTVDDSARAHALLRSIQEIITNTARHAQAQNLWIHIEHTAGGLAIHARDDGRGVSVVTWGNGLRGMRERFEEYSGRLEVGGVAGRGFEVHGFLPMPQRTS